MRVLYCTDTYLPQINGVSVVTAISAAGLAGRGWDCLVVAPKYPAAASESDAAVWEDHAERIEIRGAMASEAGHGLSGAFSSLRRRRA